MHCLFDRGRPSAKCELAIALTGTMGPKGLRDASRVGVLNPSDENRFRPTDVRRLPLLFILAIISGCLSSNARAAPTLTNVGEAVLRDRVHAYPNAGWQGRMVIELDPGFNMSQLQSILGIDHFNWMNEIIGLPSNAQLYRQPSGGSATLLFPSVVTPFIDPPTDDANYYMYEPGLGNLDYLLTDGGIVNDTAPYYWNEEDGYPSFEWQFHQPVYGLNFNIRPQFVDSPGFRAVFGPGALSFRTRLVGVKDNGDAVYWEGIGTNVLWSTDAHTTSDGVYFKTLSQIPITGGGVFGVRQDNVVPEASTFALAALGILGILSYGCRRSLVLPIKSIGVAWRRAGSERAFRKRNDG